MRERHSLDEAAPLEDSRTRGSDGHGVAAYSGNPLIEACGPILSPRDLLNRLVSRPPAPSQTPMLASHVVEHELANLWRLHIPTAPGLEVPQTLDLLIRQGYVHRRPGTPSTRRLLAGLPPLHPETSPIQLASAVSGVSGVGKSQAIERALALKPQVVVHERLAGLEGSVKQLVWLKIDVPESGKLADFADALLRATDQALGTDYHDRAWRGRSGIPRQSAAGWLANVRSHFLGVLVLDEVQNFFRLQSRETRAASHRRGDARPELRIVEDELLKFVLILNNSKLPVVLSGTPDGISALEARMSTASRMSTGGLIHFPLPAGPEDPFHRKHLLPNLERYQWLPDRVEINAAWRKLIYELSGGVMRNIIGLWFHAQRHAVARNARCLEAADLEWAANGPQMPNRAAVQALLGQDPRARARFEDLAP